MFVILLSLAFLVHTQRLSPWVAGLGLEATQIVCYVLLITVKHPIAKYVFVMIATAASQSFFAIIWPGKSFIDRLLGCTLIPVSSRAHPGSKGDNHRGARDRHNQCEFGASP